MTSTPDQPGCLWPEHQKLRTPELKEQLAIQVRLQEKQFTVRHDTDWKQARGWLHKLYAETEIMYSVRI